MKTVRIATVLLLFAVVGVFVCSPAKYMQSFFDGLIVWAYNVLPALFPFAVVSAIALKVAPKSRLSVSRRLFGISCDSIWAMSLLCGYPIGAKAIAESDADVDAATKACAFCSTAGPIFMIATVGAKLLQSATATLILIVSHILSSLLNGLFYRTKRIATISQSDGDFKAEDFGNTVTNSVLSILSVGGLIALFYMLSDMLKSFLPQEAGNSLIVAFAVGLLEMTNGVFAICKLTDVATATVLCSSLLALGGMCVFLQCYAFLGKKKVKPLSLIKMKLTQSALATVVSFCLVKLFLN